MLHPHSESTPCKELCQERTRLVSVLQEWHRRQEFAQTMQADHDWIVAAYSRAGGLEPHEIEDGMQDEVVKLLARRDVRNYMHFFRRTLPRRLWRSKRRPRQCKEILHDFHEWPFIHASPASLRASPDAISLALETQTRMVQEAELERQEAVLPTALQALNPKDRAMLLWRYTGAIPLREIAALFETSPKDVRQRVWKAKRTVRAAYL